MFGDKVGGEGKMPTVVYLGTVLAEPSVVSHPQEQFYPFAV
jgi:hypothetical protein